jgi:hypothetical protein
VVGVVEEASKCREWKISKTSVCNIEVKKEQGRLLASRDGPAYIRIY